jgi:hypothetical protein
VTDEHDELRDRLRAVDPAASLPRPDPDRVARLLEETMSNTVTTEPRTDDARHRNPLAWLVAAAAVVIIAGVGAFVLMNGSDDPGAPVAGSDPTSSTNKDSVTELRAPGADATAGRCLPVTAAGLEGASVAFDGTVEEIKDGLVTLRATHWYAGDPTDLVTVQAPSEDLQALLVAVDFQDGERYLVAATGDEQLMVCGFSAPFSQRLAGVYEQAFGS